MSDYDADALRHYKRLALLNAELRGVIKAALDMAASRSITAQEALELIREQYTKSCAAMKAAWDEYEDGEPR